MKYDLKVLMLNAWKIFRRGGVSFAEALHRAWLTAKAAPLNAERVEQAKASAGISEAVNTWARWRDLGFEVIHGSKALFGVTLIWGARGDGAEYKASFFGESQVRAITA